MFAAIVGSISFWGSNIAFGKLQEILPGATDHARRGPAGRSTWSCSCSRSRPESTCVAGAHSELLFIGMLVCAALLGNFLVLPIGGADMPVVISMLNSYTGLSAAAMGSR